MRTILKAARLALVAIAGSGVGCDESKPVAVHVVGKRQTTDTITVESTATFGGPAPIAGAGGATAPVPNGAAPPAVNGPAAGAVRVDALVDALTQRRAKRLELGRQIDALEQAVEGLELALEKGRAGERRTGGEAAALESERAAVERRITELDAMVRAGVPVVLMGKPYTVAELEQQRARGRKRADELARSIAAKRDVGQVFSQDAQSIADEAAQTRERLAANTRSLALVDARVRSLDDRTVAVRRAGGDRLTLTGELDQLDRLLGDVADGVNGESATVQKLASRARGDRGFLTETDPQQPATGGEAK